MQKVTKNWGKMIFTSFSSIIVREVIRGLGKHSFVEKRGGRSQTAMGWGLSGKWEKGRRHIQATFQEICYEKAEKKIEWSFISLDPSVDLGAKRTPRLQFTAGLEKRGSVYNSLRLHQALFGESWIHRS